MPLPTAQLDVPLHAAQPDVPLPVTQPDVPLPITQPDVSLTVAQPDNPVPVDPMPAFQPASDNPLTKDRLDVMDFMLTALPDCPVEGRIPSAIGSGTSESLGTWYGLPVLPKVLFSVASIGSLLPYVTLMAPKPGDLDIPFTIGSQVCLHDLGSGELQPPGEW